jgi:hypothetical protein
MQSTVVTLVLVVVAVVLIAVLVKFLSRDKIEAIIKKRKPTSLFVCPAEFVDGPTRFDVALSVDNAKLYYENGDMQSFLELRLIDEVEYDEDLMTGSATPNHDVLRLRSHGRTFEFVLTREDAARFRKVLPQHRADEPGDVHAEPVGAARA